MAKTVYYFRNAATGEVFETSHPEYHKTDIPITPKTEGKRLLTEQVKNELRKRIKPGHTVYTQVKTVSRSGMSRVISCYIIEAGRIKCIDGAVSDATGTPWTRGGLKVSGCGMDMGFHLVYNLGACLWPDGTPEPHGSRNGTPDSSGGYALKHEWL
jgi:hypothetical protein